ncbi:hypothetical protein LCGC14_1722100 [marine sediment metagenome]|uniref:Uncharacterized protein n=1 Tax=marine sediment metagenome TaxID=412755 RepID=A0A0F9JSJ3_9ZZZZ
MPKPSPAHANARQGDPPEVADADVAVKPDEGSASKPRTPGASGAKPLAPSDGTAS